MKVRMTPHVNRIRGLHGGINRCVEAYFKHLPQFGIELVDENATSYDLWAAHVNGIGADVLHSHGLYFFNDYPLAKTHFDINGKIINTIRHAKEITVPSNWVAKTYQRDMHYSPHVVPHGIDWDSWQIQVDNAGYILWNKNRPTDSCSPQPVTELALLNPDQVFVTTFKTQDAPQNVHEIGTVEFSAMKKLVQQSSIYLSTARETFGIGTLEAMASGVPVLGWDLGGNRDLITHGVTGYLATPGSYDELNEGLLYCLEHREALGDNAREAARLWTWESVAKQVSEVYKLALSDQEPTVGIVIPSYNYGGKVGRAIESAINQTYPHVTQIVVVDDGSPDEGETERITGLFSGTDDRVHYIRQENSGVAIARNRGISHLRSKYVVCIDADDAIEPDFCKRLVPMLEADRSLGIAYTGLRWVVERGVTRVGKWPGEFHYDKQLAGENQIPTCCMFRREMWERLGGYRQRYAPTGAGSEDAEFWLRAGANGYNAIQATDEPLFIYSLGTGHTFQKDYEETDWLNWHPWCFDLQHPFASIASPENNMSHPVRQYDSPLVSVVIPVGPGHEEKVIEALDSLEAQTFREWEVIVAWDCETIPNQLLTSYPYVNWVYVSGLDSPRAGAGVARNKGAGVAKAPFLLFLDADDFLKPTCLQSMLEAWQANKAVIYSDYEAHATGLSPATVARLRQDRRLLYHDGASDYTVWNKRAGTYDWMRAQRQPENPPYIWNLISSLVPRAWHDEIGGFDEEMPSWEDWDYFLRLAMAGKPFARVTEELVVYLYDTGSRRHDGEELAPSLLQYLEDKYKEIEMTPCRGCGGKRQTYNPQPSPTVQQATQSERRSKLMPMDDQFVRCKYKHPNTGRHGFIGPAAFDDQFMLPGDPRNMKMIRNSDGTFSIDYGYRKGGDIFLAHKADIEISRYLEPIEQYAPPVATDIPGLQKETPPEPVRGQRTDIGQLMKEIEEVQAGGEDFSDLIAELDALPPYSYEALAKLLQREIRGANRPGAIQLIQEEIGKQQVEGNNQPAPPQVYPIPQEPQITDPETLLRREVQAKRRALQRSAQASQLDKTEEISYSDTEDLQSLPGISQAVAEQLFANGYRTVEDLSRITVDELRDYRGVGTIRAQTIIEAIATYSASKTAMQQ